MGGKVTGFGAAARGVIGVLLLAACAAPELVERGGPTTGDLMRLAAPRSPPVLEATETAGIAAAAAGTLTVSAARFAALPGARMVEISAIPWLRASPEGAAFLEAGFPRALARGTPAASCPAAASSSAASPSPPASRPAAAEAALGACLDVLARRGAPDSCGCRLMAVDDALLAPQADFTFAPVVSALMIGPEGPRRLVAETLRPTDGAELVSLRDPGGEVAWMALAGDSAELIFLDGARFSGGREPFGYRRGRLAERLVLASLSGQDLTILIGVEARDAFKE